MLTGGSKISVKLEAAASPRASELVFDGVKYGAEKKVAEPLVIANMTGLEKVPPKTAASVLNETVDAPRIPVAVVDVLLTQCV